MSDQTVLDYSSPRAEAGRRLVPPVVVRWLNIAGPMLALLAIFGVFCLLVPESFPTMRNIETMLRQSTIVAIAAMGMTLIMISGGIDLSVGSMIALVTVVIAAALQADFSPWMAALFGIGMGLFCGLINGVLVTALRVVPFIVTLGTLLIYRGVAKMWAHDQKIDAPMTGLNDLIEALGRHERWKLFPMGVWIMFAIVLLMAVLLRYTRFGRHSVAIGSNELTARLCGIPINRAKIAVYSIGGLLTGVGGLMQFSRLTVGDPTVAIGLELDVIAAVVIGGGSLNGGEGSALGSLIGALIMTVIRSGCSQRGWPNHVQEIVTGVIIVVAVTLDRLRHRRAS